MRESKLTKHDYVQAAKLLARTKLPQMPLIIDVLKQGGIEISEDAIAQYKRDVMPNGTMEKSKRNRYREPCEDWLETDDPTIIRLRKAYISGLSISELSNRVDFSRPQLYNFLHGYRKLHSKYKWLRDALEETFDELGI